MPDWSWFPLVRFPDLMFGWFSSCAFFRAPLPRSGSAVCCGGAAAKVCNGVGRYRACGASEKSAFQYYTSFRVSLGKVRLMEAVFFIIFISVTGFGVFVACDLIRIACPSVLVCFGWQGGSLRLLFDFRHLRR